MINIESITDTMELLDAIDELVTTKGVNQFQVSWDFVDNCWKLCFPDTEMVIDFEPEDGEENGDES